MTLCSFRKMKLESAIRLYKYLMLQKNLHNIVYSGFYLQGFLIIETAIIAVAAFCSIRLYHSIELSYFIMFPMLTVIVIIEVLVFTTVLAQLYETSAELVKKTMFQMLLTETSVWESTSTVKQLREKEIAACYPLRSWIGDMYFMKRSTKLVFLGFLLDFIIYMLLTF